VSGHLPSGHSACLTDAECQGRCRPDKECQSICLLNTARVLQTQSVKADVVRRRSIRAFAFWVQRMSYRCRMSRQMSSGRGVSGYLASERSACLTDEKFQGRCRPEEECQGTYLLNAVHILQMQNVKTDGVRTRTVRAFAFRMQCVSYKRRMSRQMSSGRCTPPHLPCRRGVSGYLPSERSACLPDTECQDRCRPDQECQGICLLDAARVSRPRMSRQMSSR